MQSAGLRLRIWSVPILLLLRFCRGALATGQVQPSDLLRIGGALDLSRTDGLDWLQGWTLWAEKLNARGGLVLQNGRIMQVQLPLPIVDSAQELGGSGAVLAGMLNASSNSYASLDFVIGPAEASDITLEAAAHAEQADRLMFSSSDSEEVHLHGNRCLFSVLLSRRHLLTEALRTLVEKGARSVVLSREATSMQAEVCDAANRSASELGMVVAGGLEYAPGSSNFAPIVQSVKLLNPDVYIACGQIDDVKHLLFSTSVLNVNMPAVLFANTVDELAVRSIGVKNSHGVLGALQWLPSLQPAHQDEFFGSAADFAAEYASRFSMNASTLAAAGAASGYALQMALEAAGSKETNSVREALLELQVDSFLGKLQFRGKHSESELVGSATNRSALAVQIQAGVLRAVAPADAMTADVIYPLPSWSARNLLFHPCPVGFEEEGVDVNGQPACSECPRGHYRDSFLLECAPCAAGQISTSPGAAFCTRCPAGRRSEEMLASTRCVECPEGTHCAGGSHELSPCPAGHFCLAASTIPTPCPEGMHRETPGGTNISSCVACEPGRASRQVGVISCQECAPGSYARETAKLECTECPQNSFQASAGQTSCNACNATFTTAFSGADEAEACACARGTFLNRRDVLCDACPVGALCLGGEVIPLAQEGHYGRLLGDPELPRGHPAAFHDIEVWRCSAPANAFCPGSQLPAQYVGNDGINMVRLPDDCPLHHISSVRCYWCEVGYYFNGRECTKCGPFVTQHLAWVVLLSSMIAGYITYRRAGMPVPKSFSVSLLLSGAVGMLLQFIQVTSLVGDFSLDVPSGVTDHTDNFEVAVFDLAKVPAVCISSPTYQSQYLFRTVGPLLIVAVFFGNWLISAILSIISAGKVNRLSFDHTMNVCGLVVQAVYLALCKVGLQYLECRSHISAPDTLVAYPSVLCWSEEHLEMAPAGFAAITVYMVGVFAAFAYINAIAPNWYGRSEQFRNRYRFLVVRWRPDKWYWGMVKSSTNLLITLVPIWVANDGVLQVSLVLILLGFSMIMQAAHSPWRDPQNNWADQCMQAALCAFFVICLAFAEESNVNDKQIRRYIGRVINVIIFLVIGVVLSMVAYALHLRCRQAAQVELRMGEVAGLSSALSMLSRKLAHVEVEWFAHRMEHYPNGDLSDLEEALLLLGHCQAAPTFAARRSSQVSASFRDMYWQEAQPVLPSGPAGLVNTSGLSILFAKYQVPSLANLDLTNKYNNKYRPSNRSEKSNTSSSGSSLSAESLPGKSPLPSLMGTSYGSTATLDKDHRASEKVSEAASFASLPSQPSSSKDLRRKKSLKGHRLCDTRSTEASTRVSWASTDEDKSPSNRSNTAHFMPPLLQISILDEKQSRMLQPILSEAPVVPVLAMAEKAPVSTPVPPNDGTSSQDSSSSGSVVRV